MTLRKTSEFNTNYNTATVDSLNQNDYYYNKTFRDS